MSRYLVVRSWAVEADDAVEAVEKAVPGEHQDVRAILVLPSVPAVRLTFATKDITDLRPGTAGGR